MVKYSIAKCVTIASNEKDGLLLQFRDGSYLGIKKNPHVIDVDLDQNTLPNYWFII
jgi:hypothetical protein